jgi:hypothetical protein
MFGHTRPDIRCPACGVYQPIGDFWECNPDGCGVSFDTFQSGGQCPHCAARFAWTQCIACEKASAHSAFYVRAG